MITTGREMLYILSLRHGWHNKITQVPAKTRYWWHYLIRKGVFGEELCELVLPYFKAKKIRDALVVPALYIGEHKQILDEATLLKCIISKRMWYVGIMPMATSRNYHNKNWVNIKQKTLETLFAKFGWKPYADRYIMCSLWELKQELDDRFEPQVDYTRPYERDSFVLDGVPRVKRSWGLKHDYEHGEKTERDKSHK